MRQDWRDIPFSKGFLLTQQDLSDVAHLSKRVLPAGWTLWLDEAVETEISTTGTDDFLVIRGHWVDTSDDAEVGSTAEQLIDSLMHEGELGFHRRIGRFGGRFVVIVKYDSTIWVYNDATGLRSVYYHLDQATVASHLHLLTFINPESPSYSSKGTMRAMDATPYSQIKQLLPNFRLDPSLSTVERFFPFETNRFVEMPASERLSQVEQIWNRVMDYYLKFSEKLTISITGGLDSKLMLAMCGETSEMFHAYTYGVSNTIDNRSESLEFDVRQVKSLLPYLKLKNHQFIDITQRSPLKDTLKSTLQANTWGSHGPYLVPIYRDMFPGDGWFHLRGTGVEIIRRYWPVEDTDISSLLRPLSHPEGPSLEKRAKALGYDKHQYGYNLLGNTDGEMAR